MINDYQNKISILQKENKSNEMISIWIGLIKLGIVALLIFVVYRSFVSKNDYTYFLIAGVLFFILFSLWQSNVKRKVKVSMYSITIFQKHIDRIQGDWISFEDTGSEYREEEHPYANDLDLIGNKSLFQLLNLTNTYHGRKQLVKDLLYPEYSIKEIKKRQEAISELSNHMEFINDIEKKTIEIGTSERVLKIIDILKQRYDLKIPSNLDFLFYIVPIIAGITFGMGIYFKVLPAVIVGLAMIVIQNGYWIINLSKLQSMSQTVRKIPFHLKEYTAVFTFIINNEFTSQKLNEIKAMLGSDSLSANKAMKDLEKVINMISVGNNFIIYGIMNTLFMWDFLCYIKFRNWQNKYADSCEHWFESLGQLECLMSFAILPMVSEHTCMPEILDKEKIIDVKQLGHPLIQKEKRRDNDFSLHNKICIISGSNMSGKTTFMRTIGINLLLAKVGSFTCAAEMHTSIFNLTASMRIADNLNEGVSTFYAELKNIKSILDIAKENPTTFFMIDEIFRGTNSVDRLEGAQMVLKKLHELEICGVITTHDLELCQMESKYPHIENYHFSENYKNNEIIFDYTLRSGISTTTNAKQLMKMLGII